MRHVRRLLFWLRVTDTDHVFSLTHAFLALACYVYLKHPDAITAATAAAAVANYSAKNVIRRREKRLEVAGDMEVKLAAVQAALDGVSAMAVKTDQKLANINTSAAIAGLRGGR